MKSMTWNHEYALEQTYSATLKIYFAVHKKSWRQAVLLEQHCFDKLRRLA